MEGNMQEYLTEKEAREKRLAVYTEKIQETVLNKSAETIRLLVEERHNQKMTQQELSDITGIQPSNLARFESGGRIPTLIVLEKYANALGKHIEIKIFQAVTTDGFLFQFNNRSKNSLTSIGTPLKKWS
ncbi:MAG: helix-turn-helix domain-containing protein [Blautia wexlerae]